MRIDLHIRTRVRSSCSAIDPSDLVIAAQKAGFDGICITEYQNPWEAEEFKEGKEDHLFGLDNLHSRCTR
ncbi:MAG: hypothetical protein ABH969_04770 [Pseudomonadota bacterium]